MLRDRLLAALVLALLGGPAPASEVVPAKGSIEIAFSPTDDPEALIIGAIDAAHSALLVQAYVFTSRNIAGALVRAHQRGVRVEVLADAKMNARDKGNAIPLLLEAGIPVAFETAFAAAHNKVLIVDADGPGCALLTGSYNFTWSARNRNAENVLLLKDNCELARIYRANWLRHREQATAVKRLPFNPGP
ncbi:phospholipase D family nuclease [Pseudazoarcus pumilus]|uniref:phospholipase D n=1 Tax=Pseudazoarcus pumilus TaxID=2067960 RepID=A0A2I6S7D8_9RHOO|nr:phospholipase D family protein [Pseudazoarcus pumilus]AUN95168.1 endonuclease [Pseudazoarcus pumilus]